MAGNQELGPANAAAAPGPGRWPGPRRSPARLPAVPPAQVLPSLTLGWQTPVSAGRTPHGELEKTCAGA